MHPLVFLFLNNQDGLAHSSKHTQHGKARQLDPGAWTSTLHGHQHTCIVQYMPQLYMVLLQLSCVAKAKSTSCRILASFQISMRQCLSMSTHERVTVFGYL